MVSAFDDFSPSDSIVDVRPVCCTGYGLVRRLGSHYARADMMIYMRPPVRPPLAQLLAAAECVNCIAGASEVNPGAMSRNACRATSLLGQLSRREMNYHPSNLPDAVT
jgi:hypothetical protein